MEPELIRWNDIKRLNEVLVGRRIVESVNNSYYVIFRRVLDNGAVIDIFDGLDGDISTDGCEELNIPVLGIGSGDRWQGEDSVITGVRLVFAEEENRVGDTQVALVADYEDSTVATSTLELIDCDSSKPECPFVVVYYPSRQVVAFGGTVISNP